MFQWNGQLTKYFRVVSGCYFLSFVLIISSSFLLRWHRTQPYSMQLGRIGILGVNLILLCASLCTFEIKSFLADKMAYI